MLYDILIRPMRNGSIFAKYSDDDLRATIEEMEPLENVMTPMEHEILNDVRAELKRRAAPPPESPHG